MQFNMDQPMLKSSALEYESKMNLGVCQFKTGEFKEAHHTFTMLLCD